ncbi:MAG: AAA family ATPase [Solirubrobacteraceae bacterium]
MPGVAVGGLLEREVELARVDRLLDQASHGVGAVVVVEGPAGIGKSELLATVRARAHARGFGVLRARGSEFESEIAFGVARQLFEPLLRAASPAERRRLLAGVAGVGARALGVEAGEPPADRFAAIHGLFWLCANRAECDPLVVVVDDVQWVDDPSLSWLGYVARRVADLRLLLLLGLRSGDPGAERSELARLVGDGGVQRMSLGPLSAAAVGAVVRARLDEDADEEFCAACSELTGGNPLLLRELLAAAGEEGLSTSGDSVPALRLIAPAAVGSSVLARLARLGVEAIALARAVAVLGAGVEVMLAARLAGVDPVVAELAADRLAAAQIFAPARPLEFVHPLIGAAVREDIAPGARRVAHRRAAELLDGEGDGSLARVAAHLLACGPAGDQWVVEALRDAAREASANGAPASAATYLERALVETPPPASRAQLLLELGDAQLRAGLPGATERIRASLELSSDPRRRAETCLALGRAFGTTGSWAAAREAFRRGLAELSDGDDDLSLELRGLYALLGRKGLPDVKDGRLRALLEGDAPGRTRIERFLLAQLAHESMRSGAHPHDECVRLARRALADGGLLQDSATDMAAYGFACHVLMWSGDLAGAIEELGRAIELSRRQGSPGAFGRLSFIRGSAYYMRGDLLHALADLESASNTESEGREPWLPGAMAFRALCLFERDDPAGAARALSLPRRTSFISYLYALGLVKAAQGSARQGLGALLECGRAVRVKNIPNPAMNPPWRSEAAQLAAGLGERDRAVQLVGEDLRLARAFGAPHALGAALRGAGMIEGGETGLELLAEAVKTLERSQSPLELARALSDYGAALRRAGRRVKARAELERALDLAYHLGARRIAAHARGELIAAGAKPRRDAITGRDALTAGELRVARLAAEGMTNRQIAQALFITTKTVSAHLGRVYRKLELTRRGQLATALTGQLRDSSEDLS